MDLAFQTSGSWTELAAAARWATAHGAVALALPDHYFVGPGQPVRDSLTQLGALAAMTHDLELVSLASPVTFRHPAVLAKIAATINEMAPGRFVLGIGTGWLEREHDVFGLDFGTFTDRYDRLEEQLGYVAAALADTVGGVAGSHYRLEPEDIQPVAPEVRLLVGGIGAVRTPTVAGMYAGEYNAYPGDDIVDRIATMRAAAEAAGRDADEILVSSAGAVLVAKDRPAYEDRFTAVAAQMGAQPEELEEHFAHRRTPRGTVDEVRSQLAALEAAGVERFYVQGLGPFDEATETETWELVSG